MDEIREKAKERIAVDVLIHQCCDRQVYISPKDVYDYYESHILEWATPESLELQLLLVRREGGRSGLPAKEACATIAKSLEGADEAKFKSLARSWSDGPNANEGGVMGAIDRKRLRPEFEAALKNAKTGFIAGPVETPEGFYFIRVGALAPSITQPFEKVGPDIKRKLDSSAKLVKREEYLRKLREKAVIRYYF
jgi:parvulin-like peptidyl-prolyl isomerase